MELIHLMKMIPLVVAQTTTKKIKDNPKRLSF
jgi:hypothetical protein